jgi:hypothetical protein
MVDHSQSLVGQNSLNRVASGKGLNISTHKDKSQAIRELSQELQGKIQTTRQRFNDLKDKKMSGGNSQRGGTPQNHAITDHKASFTKYKEELSNKENSIEVETLVKMDSRNIPLPVASKKTVDEFYYKRSKKPVVPEARAAKKAAMPLSTKRPNGSFLLLLMR